MAKIALLIGVSEYGPGLHPLPGTIRAVEAVQRVLQVPEKGGFDEVKQLLNPNPPVMREAIETLYSGRSNDDLALLFFCGHIVRDKSGQLYLGTSIACNTTKVELIRVSAIPASFVRNLMNNSPCQNQAVILDCCLTDVSDGEMTRDDDDFLEIETQLGGKGRAILTSFTSIPNDSKREGFDHSVYTHYLAEGIGTGAADLDSDGGISLEELHEYASHKVEVAAPAVKPKFYPGAKGDQISLFVAPLKDLKLKYRKEVERQVRQGELSPENRSSLNKLSETLQLTTEDCSLIEAEVLKPYQQHQEKLQQYKLELAKVISKDYPLDTQQRDKFRGLQKFLGLREEDVAPIEERMILQLANLSESENDTEEQAQSEGHNEANAEPSAPSKSAAASTLNPPVQHPNPIPASEDEVNGLAQAENKSAANAEPLAPKTPLPEFQPKPPVQLAHPTPASENEVNGLAQAENESAANAEPLAPETPLPEFIPQPSVQLIHPTAASEDKVNEIAKSKSHNTARSELPTPRIQQPEPTSKSPVQPSNPVPAATLSANLAGSQSNSTSVSTFPKKLLLLLGIGGTLATLAVAISLSARKPTDSPLTPTSTAQKTAPSSDNEPSPSPSESPESKECTIFVNGNLRSEPAAFRENIVESLREQLPVTAKRTPEGWTEVKLPNGKSAWAHPGIISSDSEKEMETCLDQKGIKIKMIEDMLPPP
ncbi:MAG: caspase family protein [Cyanobacteriota bacterium]